MKWTQKWSEQTTKLKSEKRKKKLLQQKVHFGEVRKGWKSRLAHKSVWLFICFWNWMENVIELFKWKQNEVNNDNKMIVKIYLSHNENSDVQKQKLIEKNLHKMKCHC